MNNSGVVAYRKPKGFVETTWDSKGWIVVFYLLLSSPFMFSGIWFSNFIIPYVIKAALLIIVAIMTLRYKLTSQSVLLIAICLLYTTINAILHPNSAGQSIADLEDILFGIFSWNLIKRSRDKEQYANLLIIFSFVIATLLLIETLFFLIIPSLFTYTEVIGYEVFYNKILGLVSIDNLRPCWFFAEPSYCGSFLMLNMFIFRNFVFPRKKWKRIYYLVVFAGFISTASFGAIVAFGLTLGMLIAKRFLRVGNVLIIASLFIAVISYLTVFQNYESLESELIRTHSFAARQERVKMGKELRESMGTTDMLIGMGVNAASFKYDVGLSDAYNKMYIENGALFLIIYLMIVYRLLKKDIIVLSALVLSLMTVIVQIFPLTLLTIIIASTIISKTGLKPHT